MVAFLPTVYEGYPPSFGEQPVNTSKGKGKLWYELLRICSRRYIHIYAQGINGQQLKASSTNENTPATQDMSREEPAEELDRDNVYGRLPAHRVRR